MNSSWLRAAWTGSWYLLVVVVCVYMPIFCHRCYSSYPAGCMCVYLHVTLLYCGHAPNGSGWLLIWFTAEDNHFVRVCIYSLKDWKRGFRQKCGVGLVKLCCVIVSHLSVAALIVVIRMCRFSVPCTVLWLVANSIILRLMTGVCWWIRTVKFWDLESLQLVCSTDGDCTSVRYASAL